jgi:AraC-like DNA-binding protein
VQRVGRDELAEAPVGRYVAGETFAHYCASPRLWGVLLWGRPSERDAFELGRSLVLELAPPAVPHVSIVDCSRLAAGDPAAFKAADRYMRANRAMLERWVERLALIRPAGMGGALVAGAFEVLPRPYAVGVVEDAAAAVAWLAGEGHADLGVGDVPAMLADIYAEASSTPHVVGALRAFLDMHLVDIELPAAAKALGTSERTLQRKLAEASTSFTDELADARIRAARRMLLDTEMSLTSIALEVGCASLQHFGALFRRKTGESPSAFRARSRLR